MDMEMGNAHRLMSMLMRHAEDVRILLVGDSTGTTGYPWFEPVCQNLGAQFPAYTVTLSIWNNSTHAYDTPTVLQTGTGGVTLACYNASIGGAIAQTFLGPDFDEMIRDVSPHYVFMNLGHNELASASHWAPPYLELIVSVLHAVPDAALCLIAQNPQAASDIQAERASAYADLAARYGLGFIDVHQAFQDNGGAVPLTNADGLHPNALGVALWAQTVMTVLAMGSNGQSDRDGPVTASGFPLLVSGDEVLVNGDFSVFDQSVPWGWTLTGGATAAKDNTLYESPTGYAVRVTATGASGTLSQVIPARRLAGNWLTVVARVHAPVGVASAGRVGINDGTSSSASRETFVGQGAFRWVVWQQLIAEAATNVTVYLYGDSTAGTGSAVFDRVSARVGKTPMLGAIQSAVMLDRVQPGTAGNGTYTFGRDGGSTSVLVKGSVQSTTGSVTTGQSASAATSQFVANAAAGFAKQVVFQTAGVLRWVTRASATAESGADAGSNLEFVARTDAGAAIDTPLAITRAAGGLITSLRRFVAKRFIGNGTAHVTGDYVASANWGTGPTVTPTALDTGGQVTVLAQATTGVNPTLTLTFKDGAWTTAPAVTSTRSDGLATAGRWAQVVTTTTIVWTFIGTPVAGETYGLSFTVLGK